MSFKECLKRLLNLIFAKRPVHLIANVSALQPSELLAGRCALITGGTSGIGFALARAFIDAGATVIITGRSEERLMRAKTLLNSPDKVFYQLLDNCKVDDFHSKLTSILEEIRLKGIRQIDILVNNAGVNGAGFPNAMSEEYDLVMNTDLKGAFFLSQLMGIYMRDNHIKGNILNIASSSSLRPANSAYTLAKWGIRGLTLGLAKSLIPYGITVNGLAPGPTATPMMLKNNNTNIYNASNPLHRLVMPEEIASMAVVLVSSLGRSIVGDIVYMSGGAGLITYDDIQYKF